MSRRRHSLALVMGLFAGTVMVLIAAILVSYWLWLATPMMQAAERTKTELLASSYEEPFIEALHSQEADRLETVIGELLLLTDPETDRRILSRVEVELAGAELVSRGKSRSLLGLASFSVTLPVFSPETFELLGTVRLYRDVVLQEQQVVFWSMATLLLIVLFSLQVVLWRLLLPLRHLAAAVEKVDPESLETIDTPRGFATLEVDGLAEAISGMLNRLRESRRITERQKRMLQSRARELARSNADLESFAYVASHDLKAPLRGIDNLAMWLEEDLGSALEEQSRRHMDLLRGRVKRLERLLDDLLSYSRVGRADPEIVRVDVAELISEVTKDMGLPPGFKVETQGNMPVFSTAIGLLELVFRNLIGNAVKHHDRDSGLVEISVSDQGDAFGFAVSDDGPGIAEGYRERVFEMFQTLKTRDEVEGSGIGLAIVKKVVESQGGLVWLETVPENRGTSVYFSWTKEWSKTEGAESD